MAITTCPRCGAENKPTATMCRMCATPLEAPATLVAPANVAGGGYEAPKGPGDMPGPGEVLCGTCGAVNDSSWAFCQQCGSPLHRAPAAAPSPVAIPVAPKPSPQPSAPVAPPTVIAQPMAAPPTVIAQPMVAPPTVIAQPMAAPPTVMAQVGPGGPMQGGYPGPTQVSPPRQDEKPSGGNICSNCRKSNPAGSSFCASCGNKLAGQPAESTIAIASPTRGPVARLRLIQEGGGEGEVYNLDSDQVTVGRNSGDIRFPHDGYMSGRHARISRRGDQFILNDENSRNGTFIKIDGDVALKPGDVVLIGKQLFRFEVQ